MTTRHVSAQIPYPFEEPAVVGTRAILAGILDAYFFIQGAPTGTDPGDRAYPYVKLVNIAPIGLIYRYTFEAVADGELWTLWFDLPTTGGMGQVQNSDGTDCTAVLIFDTALLYSGPGQAMAEYIEPGRTEWHNERLLLLQTFNIARNNGVENDSILIPVVDYAGGTIRVADGYNTEISFNGTDLVWLAGTGLGKGRAPAFGNTGAGSSSGSSSSTTPGPQLQDYVSVVNGIRPQSGDIPVEVSPSLGIRREVGRLEIQVKA